MIFILMFLAHVIDDYVLQAPTLGKLKQKSWWREQTTDKKYDNDYLVGLFIHGMSWSIMVHLPLCIELGLNNILLPSILINGLIHSIVDDLKANRFKLNLIQDQLIHMMQITITFIIYMVLLT